MKEMKNNIICVMDFEGTRYASDGGKIISIGYILYDLQECKIVSEYSTIINPQIKVGQNILTLTGITQEMINQAPTIDLIAPLIKEIFEKYTVYFYNANSDLRYLINEEIFFDEQCEFLRKIFPLVLDEEANKLKEFDSCQDYKHYKQARSQLKDLEDGYSCAIDMFFNVYRAQVELIYDHWVNLSEIERCCEIINEYKDNFHDAYFEHAFFNFLPLAGGKTFTPYKFDCVFQNIREDWEMLENWKEKYNDGERFGNLRLHTLASTIFESITGSELQDSSHSALFDCKMTLFLFLILKNRKDEAIAIFKN